MTHHGVKAAILPDSHIHTCGVLSCGPPGRKQTLTGIRVYPETCVTAALMNTAGLFCFSFSQLLDVSGFLKGVGAVQREMDCDFLFSLSGRLFPSSLITDNQFNRLTTSNHFNVTSSTERDWYH